MFPQSDGVARTLIQERQAEVQQGMDRHRFARQANRPRPSTGQVAAPALRRVRAWLRMAMPGRTA